MAQPGAPLLTSLRRRTATAARGLLISLLLAVPVTAAGVTVQSVEVRLTIDGGGPPPVVRARLQETVETVAQRLLVGRPVDQLRPAQAQLQSTLATVVDRVVAGYSVADARLEVAGTAVVVLRLRPDPPLIQSVEVVPLTTADPAVAPLIVRPVDQEVVPLVRAMVPGLPVEAAEWATPLLADEIRRAVERTALGFSAVVRLRPAVLARVEIEIVARDARVVRDLGVRFRSGSIPLLLLESHAPAVLSMAGPIRGLPVAFVGQEREALERLLAERLRAYAPVIDYHVVARPVLSVGETTYITVIADSLRWRGRLEATLSAGANAPGAELGLHLGRLFGRLEVFTEVGLVPNTLAARYDLGLHYTLIDPLDLGASYTLNGGATTGFVVYRLTPDLSLRGAYEVTMRRFEGGVRYRFNEFLSGEVVGTSGGTFWLRLITNL